MVLGVAAEQTVSRVYGDYCAAVVRQEQFPPLPLQFVLVADGAGASLHFAQWVPFVFVPLLHSAPAPLAVQPHVCWGTVAVHPLDMNDS